MNDIYKFLKYIKEKFGFKSLETINGEFYVYKEGDTHKMEEKFRLGVTEENSNIDDIFVYGWVIEICYYDRKKSKYGSWTRHYNSKLYYSKGAAIDAVNQMKGHSPETDFRAVALYNFKNNGYRTYIINKILKA